jgi:hypothetical protein
MENTMSKMHNFTVSVVLLFSALALSACATKQKEAPVTEQTPVVAASPATAPTTSSAVTAEQPTAAPVVSTAKVAPKPVARKKAKAKVAAPKPAPVEPVVAPAPVVETPVAAQPEPTPPVVVAQPAPKAAPGFLEKYWLWLLGIVIAVVAVLWIKKKD